MKTVCNKYLMMLFGLAAFCFSGTDKASAGELPLTGGDLIVNRPGGGEYYVDSWLEINLKDSKGNDVFPERIPVRTRFVPHAMQWQPVNGSNDYNDPKNWTNWTSPNGRASTPFSTDLGFVPWPCTDVLIPAGKTNYSNLTDGITNRSIKNGQVEGEPICNDIWFEHGGEIARTDFLHYQRAYVELGLKANYWYMLAPPLRDMYPGDYYKDHPNPLVDGLVFYTRLFNQENPQTQQVGAQTLSNQLGGWSGTFNTPDVSMPAGFGLGVWLDDNKPETQHDVTSIWLPKNDPSFNIYNKYTGAVMQSFPLTRGNEHRFVYEPASVWNRTTGNLTLSVTPVQTNFYTLVGNPFMSHWKFDEFYTDNSTKIANEYKLLKAGDAAFTTWTTFTPNGLTNRIPPMQSILVKSIATTPFSTLTTKVSSSETKPGDMLRSSANTFDVLEITGIMQGDDEDQRKYTYVIYDGVSCNKFKENTDIESMFLDWVYEPLVLFTRSADGVALDANFFGDETQPVPLGIRTTRTGKITLAFNGIENFMQDFDVFLYDTEKGGSSAKVNIKEEPEYVFEKTTSDLFMDLRLFLSFEKTPTGISTPESRVSIFTKGCQLNVICNNTLIQDIQVFDMQGRRILEEKNLERSVYTRDLTRHDMFIVKVLTKEGMVVKKITTGKY